MEYKVFYSWQSDLPNSTNRSLIEDALRAAAKNIAKDDQIEVEPTIDRDTADIPGAPDISSTIFSKIETAQAFVADVSIINPDVEGRATPNPNVLLELGYAAKALGWEQIALVCNTAYGGIDLLPFDLRTRRVIAYHSEEHDADRAAPRKELTKVFEKMMRLLIAQKAIPQGDPIEPTNLAELAKAEIEHIGPRQIVLVRKFMEWVVNELEYINDTSTDGKSDDALLAAIEKATPILLAFAEVAEAIAVMNAADAAQEMARRFEPLVNHLFPSSGYSGYINEAYFDFYRFVGHEFFVTFIAFLLREERWNLIDSVLNTNYYVDNQAHRASGGIFSYAAFSDGVRLLYMRNERLGLRRLSLHADILHERHTSGELAERVPEAVFMAADFLLFLRSEIGKARNEERIGWRPWSTLYLNRPPRFISSSKQIARATLVAQALGTPDLLQVRRVMADRSPKLEKLFGGSWDHPLEDYNPAQFGSI